MSYKHIVIGGGSGYIGSCLTKIFKKSGVKTTIISRMPGPGSLTWHQIEKDGLPDDTNAVINLAGQNILDFKQRWTPGFKQNVWNSRVRTTKALADAIQHSSNVEAFVTISGVSYYPPDGKEYTEDSICPKYDFLSELCHAWEHAAKLPASSKVRQTTVRSGVVLGRTGGMIKQVFLPFYLGVGGPLGSGKQIMPWIHIQDIVNLLVYATVNSSVSGILNGVAPQIITNAHFTATFASQLRRPAFFALPAFLLNLLLNEERAKIMLEGQKVIPKKTLESGFEYEFPTIEEACSQFALLHIPDEF